MPDRRFRVQQNAQVENRFAFSPTEEPHRERTRELLGHHPEVRKLIGKNPYTFFIILLGVGIQLGVAALVRDSSWWLVVAAAFAIGAFASHALWVMIHECSHNLLFSRSYMNTLAGILANAPHLLPSAVSFQRYHLKHHAFQGVYDLDADLPNHWEAKLIGRSALGKALWLMLFPIFQVTRPPRLREIPMFDRWIVLNIVLQAAFDFAVYWFLGPKALAYMGISFFFSVGLHPLGARWIQEHYLVAPPQETYSYYGPLNTVAFNVGYHNEHHDLPSVPWNHLPDIRKAAPEMYDTLVFHTSWTRLLFHFLFTREMSLYSRQIRKERGHFTPEHETRPDLEFLNKA